jgi:hypothetical protein
MRADPLSQLLGRKQAVGFNDGPLPMYPLWLDGIKPGAFCRESEGQDTHACAGLFDLLIVFSDPGAHSLADMPRGIVPDQQPGSFALPCQPLTAPLKKLRGDIAHRTPINEAQGHLITKRSLCGSSLPQDSVASQRFGVGIAFFPGLLRETHWMLFALPGRETRKSKAGPPDFIEEANRPVRLLACPGDQVVASVFFTRYCRSGLVIQCLARFQLVLSRLRARRTLSSEIGLVSPSLPHYLFSFVGLP